MNKFEWEKSNFSNLNGMSIVLFYKKVIMVVKLINKLIIKKTNK